MWTSLHPLKTASCPKQKDEKNEYNKIEIEPSTTKLLCERTNFIHKVTNRNNIVLHLQSCLEATFRSSESYSFHFRIRMPPNSCFYGHCEGKLDINWMTECIRKYVHVIGIGSVSRWTSLRRSLVRSSVIWDLPSLERERKKSINKELLFSKPGTSFLTNDGLEGLPPMQYYNPSKKAILRSLNSRSS